MKWVSLNNTNSLDNFELWADEKKLLGVSFSKHTRFARIASDFGKRIFFFEKRGLFSPKKFIKNEYGVNMGKVEEIKPGTGKGYVEIDDRKYFFEYDRDNSGELLLYDESMKSLLTCSFNSIANSFSKTKSLLDNRITSLLLVLCWYSFQPHNASVLQDADLMLS